MTKGGPGFDAAIDSCSEPSGRSLKGAALVRTRVSVSDPPFQRPCKPREESLHPDPSAPYQDGAAGFDIGSERSPGQDRKDRKDLASGAAAQDSAAVQAICRRPPSSHYRIMG